MRLERLEVRDMWSFGGPTDTIIDGFGDISLIVGKNNTGKSNVLRALRRFMRPQSSTPTDTPLINVTKDDEYDTGAQKYTLKPMCRVTFSLSSQTSLAWALKHHHTSHTHKILQMLSATPARVSFGLDMNEDAISRALNVGRFDQDTISALRNTDPLWDTITAEDRRQVFSNILHEVGLSITYIGGWRNPRDSVTPEHNLYSFLDRLDRTSSRDGTDVALHHRILDRFRNLTGLPFTSVKTHTMGNSFLAEINNRRIPFDRLGDGITHLLILAVELERRSNDLFLIEEPETHLHPELQRRLIHALRHARSNQAVLTTHSPALLDVDLADRVFATEHDGESTKVRLAVNRIDQYAILDRLGARASDILQANVVIWVEGPSDRLFLKHCIALLRHSDTTTSRRLTEGIHYQIAFYGGSNRAHITANQDNHDLINILSLGRKIILIADSDRDHAEAAINASKSRLHEETTKAGGLSWITQGKEIENYLSNHALERTYAELLGEPCPAFQTDPYTSLSDSIQKSLASTSQPHKWMAEYSQHKVRLMEHFVKHITTQDLDVLDLKDRMVEVMRFIDDCNL